jgi:ribA/ribD-fused uncharacterized protein
VIDNFRGKYRFLSNFYPCTFEYDGLEWQSSEHAFMSRKCLDQPELFERIRNARTPSDAKLLGKKARLPDDWDAVKVSYMEEILREKFSISELRNRLIETFPEELIEGNTWGDKIWGCVKSDGEWVGQNYLGKTLMKIRDEIMKTDKCKVSKGFVEIFVSGPRPQNLGLKNLDPFSDEVFDVLIDFVTPHLIKVREKYPDVIVKTGMALGFDQAIAMACYINEIPFIAVIPGSWQSSKWNDQQRKRYDQLIHVSMAVENLELPSTDYRSALMTRNTHLLKGCIGGIVLNLGSSGTLDTVKKCDTMGLRFLDIGEEWKRLAESKGL